MIKAQNISEGVAKRLLADNRFHIQKQDKLFRALTNIKWSEAISRLNEKSKYDHKQLDEFVMGTVRARNEFIHEGSKWSIDSDMSTECLNNTKGLIFTYVGLHNEFVHPYYLKSL